MVRKSKILIALLVFLYVILLSSMLVTAADPKAKMGVPCGTAYIDGESEFRWNILKPIELVSIGYKAAFKTMWNHNTLYLYAVVFDATVSGNDRVEVFIDGNRKKTPTDERDRGQHYVLYRDGKGSRNVSFRVKPTDGGYCIEAAFPLEARFIPGEQIGFDIRFTDGDTGNRVSWSDTTNAQEQSTARYGTATFEKPIQAAYAIYGTPVIDGRRDDIWEDALEFETNTWVQGITGATAKVKTLWDDQKINIYAEVTDRLVTGAGAHVWDQDSIEIFIDQNNGKTAEYEEDDAHYRVSAKNVQSFGKGASADNIISAVRTFDGGYAVEAAVTLNAVRPMEGMLIGFDFQVNDDRNGNGTRDSVVTWNDGTGRLHQDPSRFGILQFVKAKSLMFTDIYDVAWAQQSIEFLASKGMIKTEPGKKFRPMDEITRADFLFFLINTLKLTTDTDENFQDIEAGSYYYDAIATARKLGITTGVGENRFMPQKEITRQDIMTFVVRALNAAGKSFESADVSLIEDTIDFSILANYARDSVAVFVDQGWIQIDKKRIHPLHNMTRAEAAVLLHRIYTDYLSPS